MVERLVLPEELDAMAPGPGLAALLDTVDLARVNGYDAVRLACAAARQVAHDQSRLLACVATVARCAAGGPAAPVVRLPQPDLDSAVDEVGFALHLTPTAAGLLVSAAQATVTHPGLRAAMAAGALDQTKLRVVTDAIGLLQPAEAALVVTRILPDVAELTTGQLRARLARLVLCVDPDAVAQRRDQAITGRRVAHYTDPDGTAALAATGLPLERAAAAWDRLDHLASTAKRHGDARTVHQLRADLLLDLLEGNPIPDLTGEQSPTRGTGLHIVAPLDTLRGLSHQPAHLSGWGPIAADVLRRLAADPTAERRYQVSVLDKHGHLIGTVITARHRFPTTRQARHIRARDLTCRAPGLPGTSASLPDRPYDPARTRRPHPHHELGCVLHSPSRRKTPPPLPRPPDQTRALRLYHAARPHVPPARRAPTVGRGDCPLWTEVVPGPVVPRADSGAMACSAGLRCEDGAVRSASYAATCSGKGSSRAPTAGADLLRVILWPGHGGRNRPDAPIPSVRTAVWSCIRPGRWAWATDLLGSVDMARPGVTCRDRQRTSLFPRRGRHSPRLQSGREGQ